MRGLRRGCQPARDDRTRLGRPAAAVASALLAAAMVAACGSGGTSSTTPKVTAPYGTLVNAGTYLLNHGNVSAAEQLYLQAIAKNPADPVAHYDLGVVYQGLGDRRDALRQYRVALSDNPRYTPALFNEAVLIAPKNAPLAIYYYRRVLAIKPDSPTALLNLGLLEAATKWPRKIYIREIRRAVSLDPSLRSQIPAPLRAQVGKG